MTHRFITDTVWKIRTWLSLVIGTCTLLGLILHAITNMIMLDRSVHEPIVVLTEQVHGLEQRMNSIELYLHATHSQASIYLQSEDSQCPLKKRPSVTPNAPLSLERIYPLKSGPPMILVWDTTTPKLALNLSPIPCIPLLP